MFVSSCLVVLRPGQSEPLHKHRTPEWLYVVQGAPVITLHTIKNRVTRWQCVSIPSECPHAIDNDGQEDVVIIWNYISHTDKVRKMMGNINTQED